MNLIKIHNKGTLFIILGPFVKTIDTGNVSSISCIEYIPVYVPGIIIFFSPENFAGLLKESLDRLDLSRLNIPGPDVARWA